MFNLNPTEKFSATVKVNVATQSGGWCEESFVGEFLRTKESEREELLELKNIDLVRRVLTDWKMVDESKTPVPFTPENFEAFLQLTGAVRETAQTYFLHNVGAKQKN